MGPQIVRRFLGRHESVSYQPSDEHTEFVVLNLIPCFQATEAGGMARMHEADTEMSIDNLSSQMRYKLSRR